MPTVYLYRFRATFHGPSEVQYELPPEGSRQDGLLFARQEDEVRDDAAAREALRRHGFADAGIRNASSIDPEAIQKPANAPMMAYVRRAFELGAAVAWYGEEQDAATGSQGSPSQ
jgi:hypothetical protein